MKLRVISRWTFIQLICLAGSASLWCEMSWAAINLQRVQNTESGRVDLVFDGKVDPQLIRTEFFNDTIQLSLEGVNVYPAKISNYSGQNFQKIFAYQYAPGLVRCRLTMKGKAEDYKDQFQLSPDGKILSIRLGATTKNNRIKAESASSAQGGDTKLQDTIAQGHARPLPAKKAAKTTDETVVTADERTLLQKVLGVSGDDSVAPATEDAKAVAGSAQKNNESEKNAKRNASDTLLAQNEGTKDLGRKQNSKSATGLGGAPELPSPVRAIAGLVAICSALGLLVLLKKGRGGSFLKRLEGNTGFQSILGNLGHQSSNRLIEVLSNHSLGPRKSIAVVRIGGRRLVLGVTNEAIHLITQLDGTEDGVSASTSTQSIPEAAAVAFAFGQKAGTGAVARPSKPRTTADRAREEAEAFDLEALARESAESPELFRPGAFQSDLQASTSRGAGTSQGVGATVAGRTSYPEPTLTASSGSISAQNSEPSLAKSSAIRDRIRNRLGSMKQL